MLVEGVVGGLKEMLILLEQNYISKSGFRLPGYGYLSRGYVCISTTETWGPKY